MAEPASDGDPPAPEQEQPALDTQNSEPQPPASPMATDGKSSPQVPPASSSPTPATSAAGPPPPESAQEKKARDFMLQAEKKIKSSQSFFGGLFRLAHSY